MPRKNRRRAEPEPRRSTAMDSTVVDGPGGRFQVRRITGSGAEKAYRCPGCDLEIRPGTRTRSPGPTAGTAPTADTGTPAAGTPATGACRAGGVDFRNRRTHFRVAGAFRGPVRVAPVSHDRRNGSPGGWGMGTAVLG
ncbi:hypothetical protein GCM10029992_65760 [Glycomyces albus]